MLLAVLYIRDKTGNLLPSPLKNSQKVMSLDDDSIVTT